MDDPLNVTFNYSINSISMKMTNLTGKGNLREILVSFLSPHIKVLKYINTTLAQRFADLY